MGNVEETLVQQLEQAEELKGKLSSQTEEDKLMHTVLQGDKDRIDEGKLLNEALTQGLHAFNPDLMFSQLTNNYQLAEQLHGERLIQLLSGYNASYIKKNIRIPEFQRELQLRLKERKEKLVEDGALDEQGRITEDGYELATMVLYLEELEHLLPKGQLGATVHKKRSHHGDRDEVRGLRSGDRYRDLAVRESVSLAIRRGHLRLDKADLKISTRSSKGSVEIIYGLDASGSMKGAKLRMAKRAGVALAHRAISRRDKVGLVVFRNDVQDMVEPTSDLKRVLSRVTRVTAARETNIVALIRKAVELFGSRAVTKHLVLLTDALPTVGKDPEKEARYAVSDARAHGITLSIVGINLDKKGEALARQLSLLGEGRLYSVKALDEVDTLVLDDYDRVTSGA